MNNKWILLFGIVGLLLTGCTRTAIIVAQAPAASALEQAPDNVTIDDCGVFATNLCDNGGCAMCKGKLVHARSLLYVLEQCNKTYDEACQ
jgi:hypothetical protein